MNRRPRSGRDTGNAALELLLVAPVLLLLIAAVVGIGRVTAARAALAGVAREGARAAVTAPNAAVAIRQGQTSAQQAAVAYGMDLVRLSVDVDPQGFVRGGTLVVIATYRIPLTDLPSFGLLPRALSFTVRQAQPIDPYASR
jgi:Flp pilus assembly protein TadG